jgi:1-deoxy-D-xylulose-5-phosphate reductoisomerase
VAVLGSTGSIGTHTLDVIAAFPERFRVVALAAGRNLAVLDEQVRRFRPAYVCADLPSGELPAWPGVTILPMAELAAHPDVRVVVGGTAGTEALEPLIGALAAGKTVALANKEILVMAGRVVTDAARRGGGALHPVDSEHSALWQCLWGEQPESVARLILTASGGAFRDLPVDELAGVTPERALHHPTWKMGKKITVDSATLMNKGLETIEARWLFDVPLERVDVLMHRESIVHSLVEFTDGSVKAQLGEPDMRLPILCALSYPERLPSPATPRLDLARLGALHFGPVDLDRYPMLALAMHAGRQGQTYPAVLVGAGEVTVQRFLAGQISFLQMAAVVEDALTAHTPTADDDLGAVLAAADWGRRRAAHFN